MEASCHVIIEDYGPISILDHNFQVLHKAVLCIPISFILGFKLEELWELHSLILRCTRQKDRPVPTS